MSAGIRARPWESAARLVAALELERKVEPVHPDLAGLLVTLERGGATLTLPPFPAYLEAVAGANERARASVRFLPLNSP